MTDDTKSHDTTLKKSEDYVKPLYHLKVVQTDHSVGRFYDFMYLPIVNSFLFQAGKNSQPSKNKVSM